MKKLSLSFLVLLLCLSKLGAQQFKWVKGGGTNATIPIGSHEERIDYMCTDPNGNVYALGVVANNPIYADTFYRSGAYGNPQNIFLSSYNCNGQMRWAKLIAATDQTTPYWIEADSLGHIYVAGHFQHVAGSHTFYIGYDTVIGTNPFLAAGLIQFDTSGNYKWVRFIGQNTMSSLASIHYERAPLAIDAANNVHMFPYMKSGVILTPTDTSRYGVYDMTYTPSGTLASVVRLDMDSQWMLHDVVIDHSTNKLYACGEINQSIYGGFLTDTFYAAAFDASRSQLWQYFCGIGGDDGIGSIVMDNNKNLTFAGTSQGVPGSTAFSFNGDSISSSGLGRLAVIMQTDTNGTVRWFSGYGSSTSVNFLVDLTLLPNNYFAAVGGYGGIIRYYTFYGTATTSVSLGQDPYLVIVDSSGHTHSVQQIWGNGFYDHAYAVTSDKVGNIYVGGKVEDSIWGGSPAIPAYHTHGGNTDFFVMKYGVDCGCTYRPWASFIDTGWHTVGTTYTGTTVGIDSIVWNFGDGYHTTGTSALHTYTAIDTYQLCVSVYTGCGMDSTCTIIAVRCLVPPVASFTDTGTHTVGFSYTGTTAGIDSIVWTYGDGYTGTGMSPIHTYSVGGTFHVCVAVYTPCGWDTSCSDVIVTIPTTISNVLEPVVVHVYPNPSNNVLYISGTVENAKYQLSTVTGAGLQQGVFDNKINMLSLNAYPAGVYVLEIIGTNGDRHITRVIKQ